MNEIFFFRPIYKYMNPNLVYVNAETLCFDVAGRDDFVVFGKYVRGTAG